MSFFQTQIPVARLFFAPVLLPQNPGQSQPISIAKFLVVGDSDISILTVLGSPEKLALVPGDYSLVLDVRDKKDRPGTSLWIRSASPLKRS